MSGIYFSYKDLKSLLDLNIALAHRLNTLEVQTFALMHCDLSGIDTKVVKEFVKTVLRESDIATNYKDDYFFILPLTDKYGATFVLEMIAEFFDREVSTALVEYPKDADTAEAMIERLQRFSQSDLSFLDEFY